MGTVAGLVGGAGLLLIWLSCWERPAQPDRETGWGARLRDQLVQAGVHGVSPAAFVLTSLGLGLVVLVVGAALTSALAVAMCFAVMAALAPTVYVRSRARRRRTDLRELWPDVVDNLVSAVRAGMSLPEALIAQADRGPEQLRGEFAQFASDYRATGRFNDALDHLKARLADPVADRLAESLRITREVGGTDLGRLLRTLSAFLREDLRTRAELEARQSWTVNGARLAALAPWVVLALLCTQAETAAAFDTPAGVLILLAGAAASVISYILMLRLGRLPEEARVLR